MIEKEKLEAVAVDFADIKPVFETTNGNAFDVSKVFTTVKAKNEKTGKVETHLVTSERDIEIQMEIGIRDGYTEEGVQIIEFMKNDYTPGEEKIYSRCPDNFLEFLNQYFAKYNRYPNINVNLNKYYDIRPESETPNYQIQYSVQGPLTTMFMSSEFPSEQINLAMIKAIDVAKEGKTNIPMTNQHYYIEDTANDPETRVAYCDCLISKAKVEGYIHKGEDLKNISGELIITNDTSSVPQVKNSYPCWYKTTGEHTGGGYHWGVWPKDETKRPTSFETWKNSDYYFGTFTFVMNEQKEGETDPQYLDRIELEGLPTFDKYSIGLSMFTGATEDTFRYLYALSGFLEEISNRTITKAGQNDAKEDDGTVRFKIDVEIASEQPTPKLKMSMAATNFTLEREYVWDSDEGKYKLSVTYINNILEGKLEEITEDYLYFDPALRLPTIYRETEDEIPFSLKPADYHTI